MLLSNHPLSISFFHSLSLSPFFQLLPVNLFLSFPSDHPLIPFQSLPSIYPLPVNFFLPFSSSFPFLSTPSNQPFPLIPFQSLPSLHPLSNQLLINPFLPFILFLTSPPSKPLPIIPLQSAPSFTPSLFHPFYCSTLRSQDWPTVVSLARVKELRCITVRVNKSTEDRRWRCCFCFWCKYWKSRFCRTRFSRPAVVLFLMCKGGASEK